MAYVTQQAVLQEAGLWERQLDETPSGLVNGSNKSFTVSHKPLADNNYDDEIDAADVIAYVDGSTVTVTSVDEGSGTITLASPPANNADVTVDYSFSSITSDFLETVIEEAEEFINLELSELASVPYSAEKLPKTVRRVARVYAAGLLMSREYGFQNGLEETTKEGDRKIKEAERWLAAYRARIDTNGQMDDGTDVPRSSSAGRIFQRYDSTNGWTALADENVTLDRGL